MDNNNTITIILIVGVLGVAGYFLYENYKKQKYNPSLNLSPSTNSNSSPNQSIFTNAADTVNNFLSNASQPNSALTQSGLLNNAGVQQFNEILNNPLLFNDLLTTDQYNSLGF